MNSSNRLEATVRRAAILAATAAAVITLTVPGHAMTPFGKKVQRPAASEFGLGPRTSARGVYVATLEPETQLRRRAMQTVRVTIVDADGHAIDHAPVTIDGGMPQHGHGLPTRPRVTAYLGGGVYQVEGVRFSMGGWWELKVTVAGPNGADTVTFNLDL